MQPTSLVVTPTAPGADAPDAPAAPALTLAGDTRSVSQAAQQGVREMRRVARIEATCVLAVVLLSSVASSTVIRVPLDAGTITEAVAIAAQGDTVLIAPGVYVEHDIALHSTITILGETGLPEDVVVDAQSAGRIFECAGVDEVLLAGLTLTGGLASGSSTEGQGGAIRCSASSLVVQDCDFRANESISSGGALMICGGAYAALARCTFANNVTTDYYGGAIRWQHSSGSVTGCVFDSNQAYHGGAVDCYMASVAWTDCAFDGNHASEGGAMECVHSLVSMVECSFLGNTAAVFGGALRCYAEGPSEALEISHCLFAGSSVWQTGSLGGAIMVERHNDPAVVALEGCTFRDCEAGLAGGAVVLFDSHSTVSDCSFEECSAYRAGAVGCSGGDVSFERCVFASNEATENGGGLASYGTSSEVLSCTFVANSAGTGAGVMSSSGAVQSLERTIIAFSTGGAAIAHQDSPCASLACCDLFGNEGGDWVGCLEDQLGVAGNFSQDPLFCLDLVPTAPYTLDSASPCAPSNNPSCGLIGAQEVGCQTTEAESMSWGKLKSLFR